MENVNDNMPVFDITSTEMSIMENLPAGTFVGQVTARDADRENVFYAFSGGETGGCRFRFFQICVIYVQSFVLSPYSTENCVRVGYQTQMKSTQKNMKCTWPKRKFCVGYPLHLYSTDWLWGLASGVTQI